MPLPSVIQFIVGMPTMIELDLWLHPASKRIKILRDQKDVTLNYMASPELISNRVSRWTMKMSQFNYTIEYARVTSERAHSYDAFLEL